MLADYSIVNLIYSKYSKMNQVKFVEDSRGRLYQFRFFKGCLSQILLDPFLTLPEVADCNLI